MPLSPTSGDSAQDSKPASPGSPRAPTSPKGEARSGSAHGNAELEDAGKHSKPRDAKSMWRISKLKISSGVSFKSPRGPSTAKDFMVETEISHLPILSCSSPPFIKMLSAGIESRSVKEGEMICKQGASGTSLILVVRGIVDILIGDQKVSEMTCGQYFGESNLIGLELKRAVTLIARNCCAICEVMHPHWEKTLQTFPNDKNYFLSMKARNESCMMDGTLKNTCKILQGLSERTLHTVDLLLVRRLYFPGQTIMVEGQPGDEFFMLVQGKANVVIAGRTVRSEDCGKVVEDAAESAAVDALPDIAESDYETNESGAGVFVPQAVVKRDDGVAVKSSTPVCFGELGFFGLQERRTASVVAQSVCQVRILFRAIFLKILEDHGESLRLEEMSQFLEDVPFLKQVDAPQNKLRLREIKFFEASCSDEFMVFLAENLEDRVFLKGQRMLPEQNSLYIVSKGRVEVTQNCGAFTTENEGTVFGAIDALGIGRKTDPNTTLAAAETCFVQVLHQNVIIRALESFPDDRRKVLLMTFNKTEEDEEEKQNSKMGGHSKRRASVASGAPKQQKSLAQLLGGTTQIDPEDKDAHLKEWRAQTHKAFMRAMQQSQLFANVSNAFLEHLSSVSIDRIYMPGDPIMEQGKRGDSMFIMVSGSAGVFARDADDAAPSTKDGVQVANVKMVKIGFLSPGSISGELAMLGISQYRSATIRAETLCSMWEITQENALSILSAFPEANRQFTNIVLNRLERTAPPRVLHLPIFQDFDRKFRMLVGLYCEKRAYFPGQHIAQEGRNGDGMYVVNMGRATLEKASVAIKTYTPGMVFGAIIMLGLRKKFIASLTALQTCHILLVTPTNFGLALEKYPCHQIYQDLKLTETAEFEEFRKAIQRISAQKTVWLRYQKTFLGEGETNEEKKISEKAMLLQTMQVWRRAASHCAKQRLRVEARKQQAEEWVLRRREDRKKRFLQDEMQHKARHASERKHEVNSEMKDGETCQSPTSSYEFEASDGEKLVSPRLPKLAHTLSRQPSSARMPCRPTGTPIVPVVKRVVRRGQPASGLPRLRKEEVESGYSSDAECTPTRSARGRPVGWVDASRTYVPAEKNAHLLTSGTYLYPPADSSKKRFLRGLPFSFDGAGDVPGCSQRFCNTIP